MSAHNDAVRMAQNLLRQRSKTFPDCEVAYHVYAPHPTARAYAQAAEELEVLIMPEDQQ